MKKFILPISFLIATQAFATTAFYVEPMLGVSEYDAAEVSNFTLDKRSTSKAVLVGYSFNEDFSAELGWLDAGKLSYNTRTAGTASFFNGAIRTSGTWAGGFDASAKGYLFGLSYVPLRSDVWDFGFRGGVYNHEVKSTMNVTVSGATYSGQIAKTMNTPYYGLTVGYQLGEGTRLGLNWMTFNDSDYAVKANIYALSLRKSF